MNSPIVNERINIGSGFRIKNIELAKEIIKLVLGECSHKDHIKHIKDRKVHDIKYQISSDKLYKFTKKIDESFRYELKKQLNGIWKTSKYEKNSWNIVSRRIWISSFPYDQLFIKTLTTSLR